MSINSLVEKYLIWEEREKWLLLRKTAYNGLRNRFFSSLRDVDNISDTDFRRYYLGFGVVSIRGFEYKLTVKTVPSFLRDYSVSRLEELIKTSEIEVIGNASWSQLHMGFRREKWQDTRKAIRYLLFGGEDLSLSNLDEHKVIARLRKVLEGELSVKGFGRAKVTPLLLICGGNDRFGVWNSVSDEALHKLKLKRRTDITKSRHVSEYLRANQALNKLKVEHGFENLIDVDLFMWYFLEEMKPPRPFKFAKAQTNISIEKTVEMFEEISTFEKEMRAFIFERLYKTFSDLWIMIAVPKEMRMQWEKRRKADIKEGKPPESKLISYADFSDYKELIFCNWKNVFFKHFKDKEKLRVRLDDLNNLCRKATMHIRTITEDEIGLGKISIRWLRSRMKSI